MKAAPPEKLVEEEQQAETIVLYRVQYDDGAVFIGNDDIARSDGIARPGGIARTSRTHALA